MPEVSFEENKLVDNLKTPVKYFLEAIVLSFNLSKTKSITPAFLFVFIAFFIT